MLGSPLKPTSFTSVQLKIKEKNAEKRWERKEERHEDKSKTKISCQNDICCVASTTRFPTHIAHTKGGGDPGIGN